VSTQKKLAQRKQRRLNRVRGKFSSRGLIPRVTVSRSLKQIYAQVIDDVTKKTIVSFSSLAMADKDPKSRVDPKSPSAGDKTAIAKKVGLELAKLSKEKSIEKIFFDRGSYRYHGRVRALAEGLREGGLKF